MFGAPLQGPGQDLPARGVSLIIAVDNDSKVCRPSRCMRAYSLPVGFKDVGLGSSPGGAPVLGLLWVKASGQLLAVSVKFGVSTFNQRFINPVSRVLDSLTASG
jgi:hypothetical protein